MRFKAELASEQIYLLHSLIGPIARLTAHAIVYLDPKNVRLSSRDADGISCFSELNTSGIFLQHRIESVADNAIVFDIDLNHWRTAMQSIVDSATNQATIMKLAKRHGGLPCLCLEGTASGAVEVYHAIPIHVLRASDMEYHLPPILPTPTVQLEMTHDAPLRTVVEKLKTLSPHVYIHGSMAGELTLRVDRDGSSIRTFFSKLLLVPRWAEEMERDQETAPNCTLKVDTKKLSTSLQWQNQFKTSTSTALLAMVDNEMLVIHVLLNPASVGFLTYYVPVNYLSTAELGE